MRMTTTMVIRRLDSADEGQTPKMLIIGPFNVSIGLTTVIPFDQSCSIVVSDQYTVEFQ